MPSFLTRAYDQVYYAAELRVQRKLPGNEAGLSAEHKGSLGNLKTTGQRVQLFFGLPAGDSLAGVAQNFLFWRSKYSDNSVINTVLKILWGISLLIVLPVQLSLVVFKCLRNILKLGTEFLPLLVLQADDEFLWRGVRGCTSVLFLGKDSKNKDVGVFGRLVAGFILLFVAPIYLAFTLWHLIGRATTSPVESVRASYEFGKKVGDERGGVPESRLGYFLGVLLAGLSVALTACVYAVLFPLAIKVLLVQMAALVSSVPHWLMSTLSFVAKLGSGFGQFLFANVPLSFLIAFNSPILFSIMAGLSLVGITFFGGVASVGAVIDKVTDPDETPRGKIEFITSGEPISPDQYKGVWAVRPKGIDNVIAGLMNSENGKIPAIEEVKMEL
jgi:hypothetical protein